MNLDLNHLPVMVDEVINHLKPKESKTYIDATFGQGGYSRKILNASNCNVIAFDRDKQSERYSIELKKEFPKKFNLYIEKFSNIERILNKNSIKKVDGIVLDLGLSNTQLNNPNRGFSFLKKGPLDMRMDDVNSKLTAKIIVNEFNQKELSEIFFFYGEERNSRKIASKIIDYRQKKTIEYTDELVNIIKKVNIYHGKHPATRVFQALRIYVNDELRELDIILKKSLFFLKKDAKIITVAFHSLEDKIIKNFYNSNRELFKILTKKPITPSNHEIKSNPRSRSARMRVVEII